MDRLAKIFADVFTPQEFARIRKDVEFGRCSFITILERKTTMAIVVTIKPDGTTTVAAEGVAGPSCKDVTAKIERALGKTVSDAPTAEMQQVPPMTQSMKQ